MEVLELAERDAGAWDAFVTASPNGLPMQLAGWRAVVAASFGVEPRYLLARDGQGDVAGVLPLYLLRSRLAGRIARSMPGGLCASGPEAAAELIAAAQRLAREAGMARLELHDSRTAWPGLAATDAHEARRVALQPGPDALWERLDRNVRRQIRMTEHNGLAAVVARGGDDLDAFYDVLRRVTHALGTPVFGRDFLERAIGAFPGRCTTAVVRREAQPVAGYFQLELGATVFGLWGGALAEARDLRAGYLAHWEIMRDASARGLAWLDMGRSPRGSGAAEFKAQWGGASTPVYQQAIRLDGRAGGSAGAPGAGYGAVARWWSRLPLPIATALGPQVRRHVPFG
jgi:FemAB-related protein (PEP-CTERM system-associated)